MESVSGVGIANLCPPAKPTLVVARFTENVSWIHKADPRRMCVLVCNTGAPMRPAPLKIFQVPNTGREALCYLRYLTSMLASQRPLPPISAFVQGRPHCLWSSENDELCSAELLEEIDRLSVDAIDRRGGVVGLGSR